MPRMLLRKKPTPSYDKLANKRIRFWSKNLLVYFACKVAIVS